MIEFNNVTFPNGQRKHIRVSGERIVGISQKPYRTDGIDCTGLIALPAFIDPHVHFRDSWGSEYQSALAGGVTMVFDMPTSTLPLVRYDDISKKIKKISLSYDHFRLWFGATGENFEDIKIALRHPMVCGVKVYMGGADRNLVISDENILRKIFALAAQEKAVVGLHAEDEELIRKHRDSLARNPEISEHCVIQDTEVEVSAVQKALQLQKETDCTVYFCRISTPESLELIFDAKENGARAYVEVCPHHLVLDSQRLTGARAGFYKINPPLRDPKQAARLRELLPRSGFIDTIASDHTPVLPEEKEKQEYDAVPSGVPGVQTTFQLLFQWVSVGKINLIRFVQLTSSNAAKIFQLGNQSIDAAKNANFVLIDPKETRTISNSEIRSRCGWTPYDGMQFQGAIKYLVTQGRVHEDSRVTNIV